MGVVRDRAGVLPEHDAAAVPGLGVVLVPLADHAAPEHPVLALVVVLVALGHGVLGRVDVEVVLLLALLVVIHEDARGPELMGVHGAQAAVLLQVRDRGLELFGGEYRLVPADGRLPVGVDGGQVLHGAAAGPAVGVGHLDPGLGDRGEQSAVVRTALRFVAASGRWGGASHRLVGIRRSRGPQHGTSSKYNGPLRTTGSNQPRHSAAFPSTVICWARQTGESCWGAMRRLNFW